MMKCLKRKNYPEHTAVEEGHDGGFEKGDEDENIEFFPRFGPIVGPLECS